MINNQKALDLLRYINTPLSKQSIEILYVANNIKYEKCELYNDFIQSLIVIIFDTYMGDDITNEQEQVNHFNWCWNKNVENFKKEGIYIQDNKLKNYFLQFMLEVFYSLNEKENSPNSQENLSKLWSYVFDFNNLKSKSDIDTLIEVYKMFENSIKIED